MQFQNKSSSGYSKLHDFEKGNDDINELITKIIPKVLFEYFPICVPLRDEFIMIMNILAPKYI